MSRLTRSRSLGAYRAKPDTSKSADEEGPRGEGTLKTTSLASLAMRHKCGEGRREPPLEG
jgi:hypothetical protein